MNRKIYIVSQSTPILISQAKTLIKVESQENMRGYIVFVATICKHSFSARLCTHNLQILLIQKHSKLTKLAATKSNLKCNREEIYAHTKYIDQPNFC